MSRLKIVRRYRISGTSGKKASGKWEEYGKGKWENVKENVVHWPALLSGSREAIAFPFPFPVIPCDSQGQKVQSGGWYYY